MKKTINTFKEAKGKRKLTMLTAYDYPTAKIVDEAGIDSILVGDSLGNVILGYENTLSVTVDDMIHHGCAVTRGAKEALVIVDMPFMSYQTSVYDTLVNAGKIVKTTGCHAVKLEGGQIYADRICALVNAGIPVCAHIGLTPQSVNELGGYKVQGKSLEDADKLIRDALAVEAAGAFAIVIECVPEKLAKIITEKVSIPTIGIGAGAYCDGQVLVYQDMLGYTDKTAKFVKKYSNMHDIMLEAFKNYKEEVESSLYPKDEHTFKINDEILEKLY